MKIAIIGANSFLGKYVIDELLLNGNELTFFSRRNPQNYHSFAKFDYPNELPDLNVYLNFDVIIYLVAAGVQSSRTYSRSEIFGLNVFYPITLVNFLEENKFSGKFISFGSYFEIGSRDCLKNLDEIELLSLNNKIVDDYAASKRLFSKFIADRNRGFNFYHIILPSIYGKGENENRLIPYMIDKLKSKVELSLTQGTQIRQFLHCKDVVVFISLIINKSPESGIYNLSPQNHTVLKDLFVSIFNLFKADFNNSIGKLQKNDESMKVLLLNSTKARSIGWIDTVILEDGIKDYL